MDSFLDTNILVRYLIGEPPAQAELANRLFAQDGPFLITTVVLLETAHVLATAYGVTRETIVDGLMELLGHRNLETWELSKAQVSEALLLCRPSNRVSFGDALIWAAARSTAGGCVYTFDQRFPSEGIVLEVLRQGS